MWGLNSEYLCLSLSSIRTIHYKFTVLWTINYWKMHTVVWCWCQGPDGCVSLWSWGNLGHFVLIISCDTHVPEDIWVCECWVCMHVSLCMSLGVVNRFFSLFFNEMKWNAALKRVKEKFAILDAHASWCKNVNCWLHFVGLMCRSMLFAHYIRISRVSLKGV